MRVAACIARIAVHLAYQIVLAGRGPQIAFVAAIAVAGFLLYKWRQKLLWTVLLAAGICVTISRIDSVNARLLTRRSMSGFAAGTWCGGIHLNLPETIRLQDMVSAAGC